MPESQGITLHTVHRCEVKDGLDGEWEAAPRLFCESYQEGAAPSYGQAQFHIYFGEIVDSRDGSVFVSKDPIDYGGKYVRVWCQYDEEAEYLAFNGLMTDQTDHLERLTVLSGSSKLTAFDMAYVLDQMIISNGNVLRNGTAQFISDCPSFNRRPAWGLQVIGNRSEDPYLTTPFDIYLFEETDESVDPDENMQKSWNALQAVHHLLYLCTLGLGIEFEFNYPTDFLEHLYDVWEVNGKSFWAALCDILDRRYGIVLRFFVDEDDVWRFFVRTVTKDDLTFGTKTIPANDSQIPLTIPDGLEGHIWGPLRMRLTQINQYDSITVMGNHAMCMGTFSYSGGNLVEWWSSTQKTNYLDVGTPDPKEADRRRSREEFDGVFTRLVVPKSWDGKTSDPAGGPSTPLLIKIDATTGIDTAAVGDFWFGGGKNFERQLFLKRGYDYQGAAPVKKKNATDSADEFLPMVAWVYDDADGDLHQASNKWIQTDRLNEAFADIHSGVSLRSLDTQMGIDLGCTPRHLFAKLDWDAELYKTNVLPEFNYRKLAVTAVVRHDQRLAKKYVFPDVHTGRSLRIDVEADLWYVHPDTMIDVDNAGAPVYYGGPSFLRDHRDVIDQVMAGAKAWYGSPRQAVVIPIKRIKDWCKIGDMITSITGQSLRVPINAVVTLQTVNLMNQTMTIETGWNSQDYRPDFTRRLGRK